MWAHDPDGVPVPAALQPEADVLMARVVRALRDHLRGEREIGWGARSSAPRLRRVSFTRPEPPYYAVIVSSALDADNLEGYASMDERMAELGRAQPGYLGRESKTGADGRELTVLYYRDAESIAAWKQHP